jgi:hypothetical protein
MPPSRQLRYQKQCRDNWKENAAKKQETIREYVQLTRSLKKSRDSWKAKAKHAEQRVKELEKQLAQFSPPSPHNPEDSSYSSEDSSSSEEPESISDRIPHHHYTIPTISIAVQQIVEVGHSYRATAKTMELFSSFFSLDTPHYSSLKSWVERIGLYELQRPKKTRNDWLYLIDLTLELGNSKALVIYGIPHTLWLTNILPHKRALKPTDGQILALEVTTQATGDWIHSVLESVSQKVGTPLQIISDHASNLRKGIQLFQSYHPHLISTYDVTHALANLLKKELFSHDIFSAFLSDCHHCRLQLQQTELAFASPPSQRTQCRFFNLDRLLNWATHLLRSDFSLFSQLLPHYDLSWLFNRLLDKFSWLFSYQESIPFWSSLLKITRTLEKQLKTHGLNSSSSSLFQKHLSPLNLPSSLNPFKDKVFHYLETEASLASHHTLLATSDVLESLFGRYKHFSQRCPVQELRSLLLTIPLCTINFSPQLIRDALTTVRSSDLSQWVHNTFGQSLLSKRKILFSS